MNSFYDYLSQILPQDYVAHLQPLIDKIPDDAQQDALYAVEKNISHLKQKTTEIEVIFTFLHMYLRYYCGDLGITPWKDIQILEPNEIPHLDTLSPETIAKGHAMVQHVGILKLNGGLGTTMGCSGPKSAIKIFGNDTFLDIIAAQVITLRETYQAPFPLVFLNSFNTVDETKAILKDKIDYFDIIQHEFPRILSETKLPFIFSDNPKKEWAPPGHGDALLSLITSGVAQQLVDHGITHLMISNSDNLGPSFDPGILGHMIENNIDFLVETTSKTAADVKGGTIIRLNDKYSLLERTQIDREHYAQFEDPTLFHMFNTNNVWLSLPALLTLSAVHKLALPLIVNPKNVEATDVVQLESAIGSAISLFENSGVILVPRNRFLPVKKTSDLLIILSDLVQSDRTHKTLIFDRSSLTHSYPDIQFDDRKSTLPGFWETFEEIPSISDLTTLKLSGPITFGPNVVLKGSVTLETAMDCPIRIDNQVLENINKKYTRS